MENMNVPCNANGPNNIADPGLISTLERVHFNHEDIKSRSYQFLGGYSGEYLLFDSHVESLCSKLNRSLHCIRQAKNILTIPNLTSKRKQ